MAKLTNDPKLIAAVHTLTRDGLTAKAIAQRIVEGGRSIREKQILSIWAAFGGKDAFISKISSKIEANEPLVLEAPEPKSSLTDDELFTLGCFLLNRLSVTGARIRMRLRVPESTIRSLIDTKYGGMDPFLAECSKRLRERRRK